MAQTPPQPSTFVEIDPPDIDTPKWPLVQPSSPLPRPIQLPSYAPTFHSTPSQFPTLRTKVHFTPPTPEDNISPRSDSMQLCTSEVSGTQHELPGFLPTPGREIHQLSTQVQGNWDYLFNCLQQQDQALKVLMNELATTTSTNNAKIDTLTMKTETHHQQLQRVITVQQQRMEENTDQLTKAMKVMVTGELGKSESTVISEIRFMMEQFQIEVQKDLQSMQQNTQKDQDQLFQEIGHCNAQVNALNDGLREIKVEVSHFKNSGTTVTDPQGTSKSTIQTTPNPSTIQHHLQPAPMVKSDHLKLTFPTFGRPSDDSDPLLYMTKCQDFLALHPLDDTDILATFRTVLYGTARDWWEVARSSITSWSEFESAFLSAFLSEDYEDELAERV